MSNREQRGLRGLVKACTEEHTYPARTEADGKTYPPLPRYLYTYDEHGNWTEKATLHRSSPEAELQPLPTLKRGPLTGVSPKFSI